MLDKCRKELGSEVENHYLKASTSTNSASIWDSEKKNKMSMSNHDMILPDKVYYKLGLLFTLIHTPVSSFTSLTAPAFISSPCMYQDLVNYNRTSWQWTDNGYYLYMFRSELLLVQLRQSEISIHQGLEVHHSFLVQPRPAKARISGIRKIKTLSKDDA